MEKKKWLFKLLYDGTLCLLNEEKMFLFMELAKLSENQFVVHKILPNVRKEFIAKNSTVIEKCNYVL